MTEYKITEGMDQYGCTYGFWTGGALIWQVEGKGQIKATITMMRRVDKDYVQVFGKLEDGQGYEAKMVTNPHRADHRTGTILIGTHE
jgi:hypothetical protein